MTAEEIMRALAAIPERSIVYDSGRCFMCWQQIDEGEPHDDTCIWPDEPDWQQR